MCARGQFGGRGNTEPKTETKQSAGLALFPCLCVLVDTRMILSQTSVFVGGEAACVFTLSALIEGVEKPHTESGCHVPLEKSLTVLLPVSISTIQTSPEMFSGGNVLQTQPMLLGMRTEPGGKHP